MCKYIEGSVVAQKYTNLFLVYGEDFLRYKFPYNVFLPKAEMGAIIMIIAYHIAMVTILPLGRLISECTIIFIHTR